MRRHDNTTTSGTTAAGTVDKRDQTGLLTRFVPEGLKHIFLYRWFLRLVRVLQLASASASLAIFSSRVYKVYRLVNSIKARRGINNSMGAVEGILAAAVLYTILATIMSLSLKGRGPRWLRWLWVLLDLAFVGAFIAVSVLTRPNGGHAGPRHCYGNRDATSSGNLAGDVSVDDSCDLPWGTFGLAIGSTVLHAITAAFHEVRHRIRDHHYAKGAETGMVGNDYGVPVHGNGAPATGAYSAPGTAPGTTGTHTAPYGNVNGVSNGNHLHQNAARV
ncbi:hypothetical protein QBC39DRAFT_379406 [Podospora conica]|nr:hypothetical protein QBC39DRAFT_379406 [Schizothecium conicum]